jgi:K+-transporting ATPase ATPase A chain
MTGIAWAQFALYTIVLVALAWPLGEWMARVFGEGASRWRWAGALERPFYRLLGRGAQGEMTWTAYAFAVLAFNAVGALVVYALQRLQGALPLNPQSLGAVSPDSSFNTAVSFATNTNWQGYGGETTMSYLTQMAGLGVQNFLSAATGIAVLLALVRGFVRRGGNTLGNFWVDTTRATLYVLLPVSALLALALVSQGVVQTFEPARVVQTVEGATQTIPLGPAASQVAIKQLGTNGGGFFNVNSAHPLENPTPLSNFLEMLAILALPAALCITFGRLVGDARQGWALLAAMLIVWVPLTAATISLEQAGTPALAAANVDLAPSDAAPGGNMEGKELRFGITSSAIWATATTAASNGSVNSMHDSYSALGGLIPMWLMQLGEVIFGGVGSGLYGMLMFAVIAVFLGALMIGRTPEYLGKKLEAFEMKMASVAILVPPLLVLAGTALAVSTAAGRAGLQDPGAHGFSEVLYALSSAGNNNGSAFAGLSANTPFYNTLLGVAMWFARFLVLLPLLALAGSLVTRRRAEAGAGTLPTHTPLFVALLVGTVLLVGALTFVPALALGPIAEHFGALP